MTKAFGGIVQVEAPSTITAWDTPGGLFEFAPSVHLMPFEKYSFVQEGDHLVIYSAAQTVVAVSQPLKPKS